MPDILQEIATQLYATEADAVAALVQQALSQGSDPQAVLSGGLIAGMDRVGRDFKAGDLFVPEVLAAAAAMHAGMDVLRPVLAKSGSRGTGTFVIGTVEGDFHDIGKNLVKMMMEGAGFEVVDLGKDVKPEAFVAAVRELKPQILGMSALLSTTMQSMQTAIEALKKAGVRSSVKIMVGGAPVTAAFAAKIGADAYAPDAITAATVARELVSACG